jgi:hypothetical protein
MYFCLMWPNPFLGSLYTNGFLACDQVLELRSNLLHRSTALPSNLQLTCRWYADETRNWQHARTNAQYESCLLPHPHFSSVVHPAPTRPFGLRADNPLLCVGPNLNIVYMSFLGAICKLRLKLTHQWQNMFVRLHIWSLKVHHDFRWLLLLNGHSGACGASIRVR